METSIISNEVRMYGLMGLMIIVNLCFIICSVRDKGNIFVAFFLPFVPLCFVLFTGGKGVSVYIPVMLNFLIITLGLFDRVKIYLIASVIFCISCIIAVKYGESLPYEEISLLIACGLMGIVNIKTFISKGEKNIDTYILSIAAISFLGIYGALCSATAMIEPQHKLDGIAFSLVWAMIMVPVLFIFCKSSGVKYRILSSIFYILCLIPCLFI